MCNGEEEFMIAAIGDKAYVISVRDGIVWSSKKHMQFDDGKVSYTELSLYISPATYQIL